MRKADRPTPGVVVPCAIYTRKSSEEGLEREFNSLDAQREACEAYVASQRHAGWKALPDMYDDGGLSGGTMERPALQRLLADVKAGKIRIIVVYKVDRLTRSLADFAKIVDVLDAHNASFVSVTQQFNTTTSMGRLTLNMLLSFAQFEREIAGERIRDKIAASKAKGMWMGGTVPLGYDVNDRKLMVNESEASTVRMIFQRYAELGSVALLKMELDKKGRVSKIRTGVDGARLSGGNSFMRGALYLMLQNRLYRGEVAHQDNIYPGQHEAIIDPDLWQIVQDRLAANRHARSLGVGVDEPSLLTGLIFDDDNNRLSPSHAVKKGKRYRYYVSTSLITGRRSQHGAGRRIPAGDIEALVLDRMRALFACELAVSDALAPFCLAAASQQSALARLAQLAARWSKLPSLELREIIRSMVRRVEVGDDRILLSVSRPALLAMATLNGAPAKPSTPIPDGEPLTLTINAKLRRAGKGVRLVIGASSAHRPDDGLVSLVGRAVATRNKFLSGPDDNVESMASRLSLRRDYLAVLLRLSYLSPEIVRAILAGQHPVELTPTRLIELSKILPHDWREQSRVLGFSPV
jgi:DNA invertase Pin-like site-specific DNA recombinase